MKQIKKLLAGLLTAALLVSLVPAVMATPAEEDLLTILDRLYAEKNGTVTLLDAGSVTPSVKQDEEHMAEITIGQVIAGTDGTASVPVYVTAPAGLSGLQMKITYGAGLTYIEAENSDSFGDVYSVADVREDETTEKSLSLVFGSVNNVTEAADNFLLTTLRFQAEAGITASTALPVTVGTVDYVTYWQNDGADIYKVIYGTVDKNNGSVTIPTTATITIGSDDLKAQAGETVTVPVSISADYPGGVNGIQMTILYDENVLSIAAADAAATVMTLDDERDGYELDLTTEDACFVGAAADAKVKAIVSTDGGKLVMWANDANIQLDGTIAELRFTVKQDIGDAAETDINGEIDFVTYQANAEDIKHEYDNVSVNGCTIALTTSTSAINVIVDNVTGATPTATVTAPAGGWVEGENTFTVSNDLACVVAVKNDDSTYTRLTATATDVEGTYSFTAELTEGSEIVVALKGDADQDGLVDVTDVLLLQLGTLSSGNANYLSLSTLGRMTCDIDGDGYVDVTDVLLLQLGTLAATNSNYVALTW